MSTIVHMIDAKPVYFEGEQFHLLIELGRGLFIATKANAMLPALLYTVYAGPERRKQERPGVG